MKRSTTILLLWMAFEACFLLPWNTSKVGAYPDNLWTSSSSSWKKAADPGRIFDCVRRQHGLMFSWLVYDRGTEQNAWYVRVDYRVLALFSIAALLAAAILSRFFAFKP